MKKILLLTFAITICLVGFSQQRVPIKQSIKDISVKTFYKKAINDEIIEKPINYSTAAKGTNNNETIIGDSYYDLATNGHTSNRIYLYDDGSIGAVWTKGELSFSGFSDRGTGYNFFDERTAQWREKPTARVEGARTGWPSYAPLGIDGELFTAHGPEDGLLLATRIKKGIGDWVMSRVPNTGGVSLTWGRTVTSGANHDTIHCIANSYDPYLGQPSALCYNRSNDGGLTWDIQNMVIEGLGSESFFSIGGDTYSWAEPHGDTIAFLVTDKFHDMVLMKSNDAGENWTKTIIYKFPIPLWHFAEGQQVLGETFVCDGSASICLDKNGIAHIAFGIVKIKVDDPSADSYFYFPGFDGIGYWNENLPTWTTGDLYNALDPEVLYQSGNLIGWSPDVNGNGEYDFLDDGILSYRGSGVSTMPNLISDNNRLYLAYASVTEGYDDGTHNFRHIWLRVKNQDGWSGFTDINKDFVHSLHECINPNLAQNSDDEYIHLIYQVDNSVGLALNDDHDYVNNSIYYTKISKDVLIYADIDEVNISELNVSQNFPNPFKDISTINVTVEKSCNVSLEVSNIMGQKVYEIPAHKINAGINTLEINAANLTNGIYFYTVKAGNAFITKKMIVK